MPHDTGVPVHKGKLGMFSTYSLHPHGLRFETQQDNEQVVLFLRQHLIVLLGPALLTILLFFAPAFIVPLVGFLLQGAPITIPAGYYFVGTIFWYLATFGYALSSYLHWFFNIYIVTSERIVDIDFINLLYKEFSEAELGKIEDLTFTAKGILSTAFNFGDVYIQTAGEVPNIEFRKVPRPDTIVKTISELMKKQRGRG